MSEEKINPEEFEFVVFDEDEDDDFDDDFDDFDLDEDD